MADIRTIEAKERKSIGTGGARAVRREGLLPGIVYGGGKEPMAITIDPRSIEKEVYHSSFYAKLYSLKIDGKVEQVIPKDVEHNLINELPTHIDFMRISKGAKLHVSIPLAFKNEDASPGLKRGGVLNIIVHELEVNCPATHIPESFEIDLTGLEIHDTIHLDKIKLPGDVTALHPERDNTIATIVAPSSVVSEEAAAEAEAETVAEEGEAEEGEKQEAEAEGAAE